MRHQVVHNRGHGFSKRFNPAGVYNFKRYVPEGYTTLPTRTARLLACTLALFLGMPAEWEWLQPFPRISLSMDHMCAEVQVQCLQHPGPRPRPTHTTAHHFPK